MNGLLDIAVAAIGSLIHLGDRAQRVLLISVVVTVWGNVIGYFAAAVSGERRLHFGAGAGGNLA